MRTIKGFITRDGEHVDLPSGGNVVEVYTDTESKFRNSGIIDTILAAGIHQVLYKREGTNAETNHFLLVRYITMTHPVTHITRYAVEQCIIDDSGMCKRTRAYNDAEHTDPYSDWSDWEEIIPSVTNVITEDSYNAITSGAVFNLREEGYAYVDNKLSEKMDKEMEITDSLTICKYWGSDPEVPAYPTDSDYSTTIGDLEEFIEAHPDAAGKYIPCIVRLKTSMAASGTPIATFAKWENVGSPDLVRVSIYLGARVFTVQASTEGQEYSWAEGWTKTPEDDF